MLHKPIERLLVLDTETGGFDPSTHSVLSVGAVAWSPAEVGEQIEVFVAEPNIVADEEALAVNGIDLDWLRSHGRTPQQAVQQIEAFTEQHFGAGRITIAGHNVWFDVDFLQRLYRLAGADFRHRFSHRTVDTASILSFMGLAGTLPSGLDRSDEAFRYFGVQPDPADRHSALADAVATAHVLTELVKQERRAN